MIGAVDTARRRQLQRVLAIVPRSGNRAFGVRRSPTHTHQGVDLVLPRGTEVRSPIDGTVTHASEALADGFSGYGRHVVVRQGDNGPWLLFAHLERVHTDPGERVLFGDVLGTVGDSCFDRSDPSRTCKGVHLHFEASPRAYPQDSEAPRLDPVAWLEGEIEGATEVRSAAARPSPTPRRYGVGVAVGLSALITFLGMMVKR